MIIACTSKCIKLISKMILNDGFSTKLYDTPISSRFF